MQSGRHCTIRATLAEPSRALLGAASRPPACLIYFANATTVNQVPGGVVFLAVYDGGAEAGMFFYQRASTSKLQPISDQYKLICIRSFLVFSCIHLSVTYALAEQKNFRRRHYECTRLCCSSKNGEIV